LLHFATRDVHNKSTAATSVRLVSPMVGMESLESHQVAPAFRRSEL
jgi:hypothetical protein